MLVGSIKNDQYCRCLTHIILFFILFLYIYALLGHVQPTPFYMADYIKYFILI